MHFLGIGIMLGLSAGFAPGPLLTLVLSETVRYGIRAGIKVACAPIVTDLPIILLVLIILTKLSAFHNILGILSLVGGLFLLYTAYESIRSTTATAADAVDGQQQPLLKGIVANLLNPHPYLFWVGVGVPTMNRALASGRATLVAFIVGFYLALVGSKILLAVATGRLRNFLSSTEYLCIVRLLALLLGIFALLLFGEGLKLLGVTPF